MARNRGKKIKEVMLFMLSWDAAAPKL